ncbi:hypothetical protein [uncultured Gemmiger sp.]|uniref:hypothetical protein n=1 Tax=uncultured Gemmiger sp. TaxID=1623490 RepID=UPI0025E7C526|nr:hypothetical protein [uncultured Gemmiger sp.]
MKNETAAARRMPRRLAAAAGILLAVLLALFAASMLGDPLSRTYSVRHAVDYANETWPGQDFRAEEVQFTPGWCYQVTVQSSASRDTRFNVWVNFGVVTSTDYDTAVASLYNTRARVDAALSADVRAAMEAAGFAPFGATDFVLSYGAEGQGTPAQQGFTLDMPYDRAAMPMAVNLELFGFDNQPRRELGEQVLRDAKAAMEAAGIRIDSYSVDIYDAHAPYQKDGAGNTWSSGRVPADQIS